MVRALTDTQRSGQLDTEPARVQPPASRTRRLPEVLVGSLLVAGCALGALVVWTSAGGRSPVLMVARPVPPGAVLVEADVATVGVAADPGLTTVPATALADVLGHAARVPLSPGTLLSPDLLAAGSAVPEGASVVGLALEPGAFPSRDLRAGDIVQVIGTPGPSAGGDAGEAVVLVAAAPVFSIDPAGEGSDRLLVAVVVPEAQVPAVAGAAAKDGVRLATTRGEP